MRVCIFVLFVFVAPAALGAGNTIVKGYLIDTKCGVRISENPGMAANHTRQCLQTGSCEQSGYGVLTEGKQFIRFDKAGNEEAKKFLADIDKAKDIKVTVVGSVSSGQMSVVKIELQQ